MQEVYLAVDIIIGLALLVLAIVGLINRGYKISVNRKFAFFSVLVGLWIISNHLSNDILIPKNIALFADYVVFSSSLGVAAVFSQIIVDLTKVRDMKLILKIFRPLSWVVCALCFTPLVVSDIFVKVNDSVYTIVFGPLVIVYALALFVALAISIYSIRYGLMHARGVVRRQLKIISVGAFVTIPLILLLSFFIPLLTGSFYVTEFGITPIVIMVACLYYSVIKYQLFDIRVAVVRVSVYVLSLAALMVAYYALAYVVTFILYKSNITVLAAGPMSIVLAFFIALLFQPIKRFFDQVTDDVFYKVSYKIEDFFGRLDKILSSTTDLRSLLERAASEIGRTLKSEQASFFINIDNEHYITAGTENYQKIPRYDAAQLCMAQKTSRGVVVASLLPDDDPVRKIMLTYRLEMVLPLMQGHEILGYLCLGDHMASGYTSRDVKALDTVSNELVIGIRNALTVHEIKEINATLQQRINNATRELRQKNSQLRQLDKVKDDFVSIASHQLRTPLTGIKGYISMVLEGDAGKISARQREFLNQAFVSSERMVRLINDFLNLSRLQTGKFIVDKKPNDLKEIISQEIDNLRATAAARGMELVYDAPKSMSLVEVDEDKIRQVVMNFIDNAIYYSHDNSKIYIDLSLDKKTVKLEVRDNGIGVPEREKEHLFTKFFRAQNAKKQRPDGTGVGLYLARKVIDAHGGNIIFESKENHGSTFGFTLPL